MSVLKIALRVDKELEAVEVFLNSKACGGFGVREVAGDNEHWHFLLETDKFRNLQAFRVALTRAVPALKGNASYSATAVNDLEKYVRYMCKGESEGVGPEVVWRNSIVYSDEECEKLHEEYWKENARLKKRKAGSMIDWVVDECKRQGIEWKDRSSMAKLYVAEVAKRGKPFNQFAARSAVNAVQLALCPDDSAINMFAELL